jgi:zinc transport system substrate-binding protein
MHKTVLLAATLAAISPADAAPKVMASIEPIHSIVAAVMGNTGSPELIFRGRLSEHSSGLSPAQITQLGEADLVFLTAPGVEIKLGQLSGSDAVNGKTFISLAEAPGVQRLALREGGVWEKDADQTTATAGAEGVMAYNGHVWLDPENGKAMATAVAAALSAADPPNAVTYAANAQAFDAEIGKTESEIAATLSDVKDKPFIVFHDAYPYFEKRFGLAAVGSISDASANAPSAKRIGEIRARIAASGAVCVFREPQFNSRLTDTVIEDTQARAGVLDAVGADLEPGPDAYRQLLLNLAASLKSCLSGAQ